MTTGLRIVGRSCIANGNLPADAILHPRLHASAPQDLARHCLAGVSVRKSSQPDLLYPILVCHGLVGLGLARPPVVGALVAAGFQLVIGRAISPMLAEIALNSGQLLVLTASLPANLHPDAPMDVRFEADRAHVTFTNHTSTWKSGLPPWALGGRAWIDELKRRAGPAA